jgi:hypothetical protein
MNIRADISGVLLLNKIERNECLVPTPAFQMCLALSQEIWFGLRPQKTDQRKDEEIAEHDARSD